MMRDPLNTRWRSALGWALRRTLAPVLALPILLWAEPTPARADDPPASAFPAVPPEANPSPAADDAKKTPNTFDPAPPTNKIPEVGDTVQFIFTSGDAAEGTILEIRDDGYRATIGGLAVNVARKDLDDVIVLPPIEERFRQMRALIEPDDTESMSALANWAFERGLNAEALAVVMDALSYEPHDVNLRTLRDMLQAQIAMDKIKAQRKAREPESVEPAPAPAPEPEDDSGARMPMAWPNFPLLTDQQVDLMKVYEVDLRHPPRIIIDRPTVDALIQNYASNPLIPTTREGRDAFRRRSAPEILDVMFRCRARDLYPEVRVVGQPESMRAFRDYVQAGWLVNTCATNRCHGGADAKDLVLYNRKPTASRSVYTNFLILERYRMPDGRPLIDYQNPERSVLLQFALPPEDAITPHPAVEGWRPVFSSRDARGFERGVRWIRMMYRPRPEYPIEYTPPGQEAPEASPGATEGQPIER